MKGIQSESNMPLEIRFLVPLKFFPYLGHFSRLFVHHSFQYCCIKLEIIILVSSIVVSNLKI